MPTPLIKKYEEFFSEIGAPSLSSEFPYTGVCWNARFTKAPGKDLWKVKKNSPGDSLSLDLIAVAERATGSQLVQNCSAAFGGGGASSSEIWIPMLDGGIHLDFLLVEHLRTNALSASQSTIIGGSKCFRYLLRELDLQPIKRRIGSEQSIPSFDEIENLLEAQKRAGTEASENAIAAASHSPMWYREF